MIGYQLIKCSSSVGANYRSACRARSRSDFISKIGIVEEADESLYWLELAVESGLTDTDEVRPLAQEANELVSIFTSSRITAKKSKIGNLKS